MGRLLPVILVAGIVVDIFTSVFILGLNFIRVASDLDEEFKQLVKDVLADIRELTPKQWTIQEAKLDLPFVVLAIYLTFG